MKSQGTRPVSAEPETRAQVLGQRTVRLEAGGATRGRWGIRPADGGTVILDGA